VVNDSCLCQSPGFPIHSCFMTPLTKPVTKCNVLICGMLVQVAPIPQLILATLTIIHLRKDHPPSWGICLPYLPWFWTYPGYINGFIPLVVGGIPEHVGKYLLMETSNLLLKLQSLEVSLGALPCSKHLAPILGDSHWSLCGCQTHAPRHRKLTCPGPEDHCHVRVDLAPSDWASSPRWARFKLLKNVVGT
jgi:hypothetical protein